MYTRFQEGDFGGFHLIFIPSQHVSFVLKTLFLLSFLSFLCTIFMILRSAIIGGNSRWLAPLRSAGEKLSGSLEPDESSNYSKEAAEVLLKCAFSFLYIF